MRKILNRKIKNIVNSTFLLLVLLVIIGLETISLNEIDSSLHIYFLDVGQGDSILIKTPAYRYILIDGGEDSMVLEELGEIMPFWERTIDLVIGTHADSDHIGGLKGVLEQYAIEGFATSDLNAEDENLFRIKEIAGQRGIPLYEFDELDTVQIGELYLELLWPEEVFYPENDNQNSVVLRGQFGEFSFILTGDIEDKQEERIIAKHKSLKSTVLKASHHGSNTATSEEFLKVVDPEYVVVSCGKDNNFGHPAFEVIDRIQDIGSTVMRTDVNGRIEFIADGETFSLDLEK